MNYLKEVYSQKNDFRVVGILALGVLVLVLGMVDAFATTSHHGDSHSHHSSSH